jgi:hypothetical protein
MNGNNYSKVKIVKANAVAGRFVSQRNKAVGQFVSQKSEQQILMDQRRELLSRVADIERRLGEKRRGVG